MMMGRLICGAECGGNDTNLLYTLKGGVVRSCPIGRPISSVYILARRCVL